MFKYISLYQGYFVRQTNFSRRRYSTVSIPQYMPQGLYKPVPSLGMVLALGMVPQGWYCGIHTPALGSSLGLRPWELPRPHAGISLYSPPLVTVQTQNFTVKPVEFPTPVLPARCLCLLYPASAPPPWPLLQQTLQHSWPGIWNYFENVLLWILLETYFIYFFILNIYSSKSNLDKLYMYISS